MIRQRGRVKTRGKIRTWRRKLNNLRYVIEGLKNELRLVNVAIDGIEDLQRLRSGVVIAQKNQGMRITCLGGIKYKKLGSRESELVRKINKKLKKNKRKGKG